MAKTALKKRTSKQTPSKQKSTVSKITDPIIDSAQDVWFAGLGAFALAQEESEKVFDQGSKMFEKLVAEGRKFEKGMRDKAEDRLSKAKGRVSGVRDQVEDEVEGAGKQVSKGWDRMENLFEDRVARVMGRLGVPTADDVKKLTKRVEKLSDEIAKLSRKRQRSAPAAAEPGGVTVYHLLPDGEDWAVRLEGGDKDLSVHDTKAGAMDAARGIAQAHEPSRLVVHRADGTIQTSHEYGEN